MDRPARLSAQLPTGRWTRQQVDPPSDRQSTERHPGRPTPLPRPGCRGSLLNDSGPPRFRDHDGQLRRVQATAATPKAAERKLKELLAERAEQNVGQGELTASSSLRQLVEVWLADLDLETGRPEHPGASISAKLGQFRRRSAPTAFRCRSTAVYVSTGDAWA